MNQEFKENIKSKEFWIFFICLIIILELGYAINNYLFCPCK